MQQRNNAAGATARPPVAAIPAPADEPSAPNFSPARLLEVELSRPLSALPALDEQTRQHYQRALSLVRLHDQPIGVLELQLGQDGLSADEYARQIWQKLQQAILAHLQKDGLPPAPTLTAAGLVTPNQPRCEAQRAAVLATAPFVSVVIATHNRTESLRETLHSLLALEYPHYNIIVVDNAPSNDAAEQMIRQEFAHEVRIRYVYEAQAGLAVAHNRGLQEVTAPIVAFTDDDVLVDRHWLTEIVRSFRSTDRVGCVTGMIIPAELETPAQGWIEQFGFSKGFEQRIFDMEEHRPPSPLHPYTAGAFGSGANMAFDTQILHAVGGFDPALGAGSLAMGGDDLASFFQIVASGYRLIYQPAAFVRHWHRRDYAGLRRQAYGYGVGLTAYLTKTLVDRPTRLLDFVRRAPRGLQYAFKLRSPQSVQDPHGYPRELTALERQGMLYGPIAYLRSRHKVRRTDQRVITSTR